MLALCVKDLQEIKIFVKVVMCECINLDRLA